MTIAERIENKVEKVTESGCWIWTAHCNNMGYGMLGVGRNMKLAHRMTYELTYGQIPKGLDLDHLCRVRCCVNPAHLEPVTRLENVRRGKRGPQTHCQRGHAFTEDNIYYYGPNGKSRQCRQCNKLRELERTERRRASAVPVERVLKTHCRKGHRYDHGNTYRNPSDGWRVCKKCRLENQREWSSKRRKVKI